ncbi:MAG: ATP-dependent helicase HrpB [Pseudomonadota bacterium]
MNLPIDAVLPDVRAALSGGTQLILAAPPGAGKTTGVPLALLDESWVEGRILVLEPRRLATRAAAERMASVLGEKTGQHIGYRIRGESKVSKATKVEVITEGILTRMLQSDPELPGVSAVLFDEVHERSIHTDLGLALCLEAQETLRPDLKVVAMSATLDVAAFRRIMPEAAVIESAGRAFPVDTRWLPRPWRRPEDNRRGLPAAIAAQVRAALSEQPGDVLVFLPGAGEIRRTANLLEDAEAEIRPLYGALPFAEQQAALRPSDRRRVVLATSIAETSLTVPGVRVVIDSGFARRAEVDRATGLSRLVTVPVSRAEADQRRGRAGRMEPGVCYRMWTRGVEGALPAQPPPEILATDLAPLALELAVWGTTDLAAMRFIDPPPAAGLTAARRLLQDLGALDADGRVTPEGREMARKPLHPRLSHMVQAGVAQGAAAEAALLAAMVSERDPLRAATSDLRTRLDAILSPPAAADRGTIQRIRDDARRISPGRVDKARLHRVSALLTAHAYPDRIAMRRPGDQPRYLLSNGRGAMLPAGDPLAGERLLIATDLEDGREARIRAAIPLSEAELRDVHGGLIAETTVAEWSSRDSAVVARRREMLGAIALSDRRWDDAPADVLGAALLDGIREKGITALPWPKGALALRTRIGWLRALSGEIAQRLPDWSDDGLAENLATWLAPHLDGETRIGQLDKLDFTNILRGALDWETAQEADRLAPSHWQTPLGSRILVDYSGETPQLSVRLQEVFGLTHHPMIGDPPVPLSLSLLSPAQRPVQVTSDLPGFWSGSYADVRRDMRARYPRHPWPEDPSSAEPTKRARTTKS